MSTMESTKYCPDHKTDEYMWYTYATNTWQCDACWDDAREWLFNLPRQYDTPRSN